MRKTVKMKYLKSFKIFENLIYGIDLMESLKIWHDELLSSINAEEVDLFETLYLPEEIYQEHQDIEYLSENIEFINSLSSLGLKKSEIKNTEDYETFLNKPCKFMFIFKSDSNELENPSFLLSQNWNESLNKWDDCKLYRVGDNIRKFYDKLTSKTIELLHGGVSYIYQTVNGNEWNLQNVENENDTFLKTFRKKELKKLIGSEDIKVNII